MDRRFICSECGTKWFIHADAIDHPDLTECGRCGGELEILVAPSAGQSYGSLPAEPGEDS